MMAVTQQLCNIANPSEVMDVIGPSEALPNTLTQAALLHYGFGDAQVTWLGAHAIARSAHVHCGNETFFGFEMTADDVVMEGCEKRSNIMGFDYRSPIPPFINLSRVRITTCTFDQQHVVLIGIFNLRIRQTRMKTILK